MDVTWETKHIPATPQRGEILRVEGTYHGVKKHCGWLLSKQTETIEELTEISKRAISAYFQDIQSPKSPPNRLATGFTLPRFGYIMGQKEDLLMFKSFLAAIAFSLMMVGAALAGDFEPLRLPSMDYNDQKQVTIHHDNGRTTIGNYDRSTGDVTLFGPSDNQITTGRKDAYGNLTITEYGGDDD